MREKERIKRILKLIGKLWESKQDMRFGQLLENYVFDYEGGFYMWNQEDDITETRIKEAIKNETRDE